MISNKEMFELLKISKETGARLLLVGDKLQLPSIGSGKPFALLQEVGLTLAVMKTLIRQNNEVLREAVNATIQGDIPKAIACLEPSITALETKDARLTTLVSRYIAMTPQERANTLLLVPANEDRHTVNEMIHKQLQSRGEIASKEEQKAILVGLNLTRSESARANFYKEGYVVRFGQDNKKEGISRNDYFTVTDVNVKKQQITLKTNRGKTVQWDPRQLNSTQEEYVEVYEPGMRAVAVGEQIRWTRNDKNLGVCNGDTGTVIKVGKKTLTVLLNNGQTLEWNTQEFHRQHWEYNYARTVHDVQGKTSSRVLALLHSYSPLSHLKLFYTALSRARDEVQLIVDDIKELTQTLIHQTGEKTRALLEEDLKWHAEAIKSHARELEKTPEKEPLKTAIDEFKVGSHNKQRTEKNHTPFKSYDGTQQGQFLKSNDQELGL